MAQDFVFDASLEDVKPKDLGPLGPQKPYIGPMKYVDVTDEPIKTNNPSNTFRIIMNLLGDAQGEQKDVRYEFVSWEPDTAEKAVNMFKRLAFFIAQFYPGEDRDEAYQKVMDRLKASNFDELKANVIKLIRNLAKAGHMDDVVQGKLIAGVNPNNGKPNYPAFPNYTGFIANEKYTDRVLSFSPREVAQNDAFLQVLLESPSRTSGSAPATFEDSDDTSSEAPTTAKKDEFDF